MRHDLLHSAIPEIAYPKYKNDILGLCVADMIVEMIENNRDIDYLKSNYKKYITKELLKYHPFIKKEIAKSLKKVNKNIDHDAL